MNWLLVIKAIKIKLIQVACLAVFTVLLCVTVYVCVEIKMTLSDVADDYLSLVDKTRIGNSKDKFYEDFYEAYYANMDITSADDPDNLRGNKRNKGDKGKSKLKAGLAQNAMVFYSKCSVPKGNKTSLKVGDVYLYDGLPWDGSNAYTFDEDTAKEYIARYLPGNVSHTVVIDNNCSGQALTKDGVDCVDFAATSILAFCDIDDLGSPVGWSKSTRPKKVCAVIKAGDGKEYYLPLTCVGDAKGHTWAGGLMETALSNSQTGGRWYFNDGGGAISGDIIGRVITDLSDIKKGYSTVVQYGGKMNPQICLEVNKTYQKAIQSTYTLVGFVAWKE